MKEGKNDCFALFVLGKGVSREVIQLFGMNSMRNINKFDYINMIEVEDLKVVEESLGYMICEIVDMIENDTHTLFIGKLIEADILKDEEAMSYSYYQENKNELIKETTKEGKGAWTCTICGYIHYEEDLPEDFVCPKCGVDRTLFEKREI